jgi:hypothetical protein
MEWYFFCYSIVVRSVSRCNTLVRTGQIVAALPLMVGCSILRTAAYASFVSKNCCRIGVLRARTKQLRESFGGAPRGRRAPRGRLGSALVGPLFNEPFSAAHRAPARRRPDRRRCAANVIAPDRGPGSRNLLRSPAPRVRQRRRTSHCNCQARVLRKPSQLGALKSKCEGGRCPPST